MHYIELMTRMNKKKRLHREKWYEHREHTCFYTGLTCTEKGVYTRSVEHLIPHPWMSRVPYGEEGTTLHGKNQVVSLSFMNHMVDTAPLQVKFLLRDHLLKIETLGMSPVDMKNLLVGETQKFFSSYEIDGYLPWYYRYGKNVERSEKLWDVYAKMLFPAEKILLSLRTDTGLKSFLHKDDVFELIQILSKENKYLTPREQYLASLK